MLDITERGALAREDRSFTLDTVEVRASDDGTVEFDGIASSVDAAYTVRDSFGEFSETIAKGAFNRTIKQKDDVRLLVNHLGVPLARTKSRTLTLTADPHLRAQAMLDPANPTVQELRSALGRKDIDQMSIGMRVKDQEWSDDYSERMIREVELLDVSVVTYPANLATSAQVRALDEAVKVLTDGQDHDPDMIRRAIVVLETLLPVETEEVAEEREEVDWTHLQDLWARRVA